MKRLYAAKILAILLFALLLSSNITTIAVAIAVLYFSSLGRIYVNDV